MTKSVAAVLTAVVVGCMAPVLAEEETSTLDVGKGVTFSKGVNSLTVGARVQFRGTWDDREQFDGDVDDDGVPPFPSGLGVEDGWAGQYDVVRMRVQLKGGFWKPWLKYEFQYEFSRTTGDQASKVKEAWVEVDHLKLATFRFGQTKAPFSLQQLTSSGRQQFVDRAITDAKFVPGRDTGVMVSGLTESKRLGYSAGMFNGSGESRVQDDKAFLWTGRAYWQPFGEYKLSEGAVDGPEDGVLLVGLNARTGEAIRGSDIPITTGVAFENPNNETAFGAEVAWKNNRFSASGEYFMMTNEQEQLTPAPDIDSSGFYAQAGWMVIPERLEVAARYAAIDPDDSADDASLTEARVAVGWYWRAHQLKLQGDVGQVRYDENFAGLSALARRGLPALGTRLVSGEALSDNQVRLQIQLAF